MPAFRKLRQEDHTFKAYQVNIVGTYLENQKNNLIREVFF
jgi:hypothetical protein